MTDMLLAMGSDLRTAAELESRMLRVLDRYRVVLANIQDVVAVHHMDGKVAWVSDSVEKVFGYTPDEWRDLDIHKLVHPDDYRNIQVTGHALPRDGKDVRLRYRLKHKDGRWLWVDTLTTPIYNGKPEPIATQSHSRDITDLIENELKVKHDLALHSALFDNPLVPVALFEPDGTFRQVNAAWQAMLGYREEELRHMTFQEVTHFTSQPQDAAMHSSLLSHLSRTVEGVKHFVKRDGTTTRAYIWGGSVLDANGGVVALFAMAQTMTRILDLAHKASTPNDDD